MKKQPPVKVKILIAEDYICLHHKLWKGRIIEAVPNYTSTKKLKGYIIKSPTTGKNVYMKIDEVKVLTP